MKRTRNEIRKKRHYRVRKQISGTPERPRLNVFRSNEQIYAQVIDDKAGHTMVSSSSLDAKLSLENKKGIEKAFEIGKAIALKAQEKGITAVVFDRGGYAYTGQIAALAKGAREGGLQF